MAKQTPLEPDAAPLAPSIDDARVDDAPPDCDRFEQTLMLVDGLLPPEQRPEARRHADACAECGPLARDWHVIGDALRAAAHAESAESAAAAPALEQRLQQAAQALSSAPPAPKSQPPVRARRREETSASTPPRSRWRRGWAAVAATASSIAAACVLLMMRTDSLTTSMAPLTPLADDPAVQLQSVTFDDADGMLMQGDDGLTVIWITEHEEP